MTQSRQETYDWYDDADALEAPRTDISALPGVPGAWQNLHRWMAGIVFSALWMLESWSAALPGQSLLGTLAESIWTLLLSLSICCGIYKFSRAQSAALAYVLCAGSAVVLLLNHAFNL